MKTRNVFITLMLLLFTALQGWWLLSIPLILYYTFYYSAAWLVPAALLIDAYFGALYSYPKLTVYMFCWFVLSEFIKPYLMWHNKEDYG